MKLDAQIKLIIKDILSSKLFIDNLYEGLEDSKKREALGQVYTPADICIDMLERLECISLKGKTILDPCCGSGNLLIAALIAGADSDRVFGNDYDKVAVIACKKRVRLAINILNTKYNYKLKDIQDWQIHQGNALQARCLIEFGEEYDTNYNPEYIDDLEYAQSYEHDGEQTFLGETSVYHVNKLSWADENKKAQERLEKKQQLEKRNTQKMIEKIESTEQISLFEDFFGGN